MTDHGVPEPLDSAEESASASAPKIRLQRFLAACGLGSRRACEQFITDGRVTVDGETITELGATVNPSEQKIALDGERLKMERKRYYVLNKPPGYLSTNLDPQGRKRVIDLFPPGGPRLFTVGRLDENSTGLIVVTNDGDLAEKLAHPRHQIFRTYHLQVAGHPTKEVYETLKEGLHFSEGRFRVRSVKSFKKVGQSTWLEVVLSQGHNRELRRLFARVGHKVLKLTRIAFGPIKLGKLAMGEIRDLSLRELGELHAIVERTKNGGPPRRPHAGSGKSSGRPFRAKGKGKGRGRPGERPAGRSGGAARRPVKKGRPRR